VRLVRLVALTLVVATVYFAQYLFDTTSLANFFPSWLLARWPLLATVARWLPADLVELAIWLTLLGLLSFGLLAPWWQGERGRAYRRLPAGRRDLRTWWWVAQSLLLLALGCTAAVAWLQLQSQMAFWTLGFWVGSILLYALGGLVASRVRPPVLYGDNYLDTVRPWDGWPYWVVLLIIFAAFYTYRLFDLPLRIDPLTAHVGLAAQAWVRDLELPGLATAPSKFPLPTLGLVSLIRLVLRDNLWSVRIAGVATALALISAVWLVGSELFRRVPIYGEYGEVLEDDGRWIALLAMMIAGVSLPLLHWSRAPLVLEGVALGTLGLWALLRGLRRDRPGLLGLSALLLGWSIFYGPAGLLSTIVALLIWWGVLLLEPSWLTGKLVARDQGGETVRVQRGVGWRGFGYWTAGIVVAIMPLLSVWLTRPGAFAAQWIWPGSALVPQGSALLAWRERLEVTVLGLNYLPDATATLHYDDHFVHSLWAPLLALALGALLLNIDSLAGWTVVTWLVTALVGVALTVPVLPDWMAMVVLLPVVGLGISFALDRLRLLIMLNAGTWTLQATVYLALGIVVTAGFSGWIDYYNMAQRDHDLPSSVGRALRDAADRPIALVSANIVLDQVIADPVVQMLASRRSDLAQLPTVNARNWPPMPPNTRLLLAPGDSALQPAVEAAYPGGHFTVVRDLHANPTLYIYDMNDELAAALVQSSADR
jgi:hypothetical protein